MKVEEKRELLTTLLERVKRNASRPRPERRLDGTRAATVQQVPPSPSPPAAEVRAVTAAARPSVVEAQPARVRSEPPPAEARVSATEIVLDEEIIDITVEETIEEPERAPAPSPSPAQVTAAAGINVDIDFDEPEEQPPSSSRRAKVAATSMDEALAGAAEQLEREVPLKTPPPESGPQEAVPPAHALQQPPPPMDLEKELRREAPAPGGAPILEQPLIDIGLSEEIAAEPPEAESRRRERVAQPAAPPRSPAAPPVASSVEASPRPAPAAAAPPAAVASRAPTPAARAPAAPVTQPSLPTPEPEPVQPVVTARPQPSASPAARFAEAHRAFYPQTFLELLDASLALGE